jgi:hypothetical protein
LVVGEIRRTRPTVVVVDAALDVDVVVVDCAVGLGLELHAASAIEPMRRARG